MLSACDRKRGKGSDIEWQQRQEEQERQQERKLPPEHSYEYVP